MITVEEIACRMKDYKAKYDFADDDSYRWEPVRVENYTVPVFHIIESQAKGAETKLFAKLSKVLAFIDCVKHKRYKDYCTIMPVSVSTKEYLAIWGSKMNVSNAIKYMIEIGLLSIENETYHFGAAFERYNYSKTYRYYKENEDKILEYCAKRNIKKYVPVNEIIKNKEIDQRIDASQVHFGNDLNLQKPEDMSKEEFIDQLTLCLYDNYPDFQFYLETSNRINERYYQDYPEFKLRFKPNFHWKGNKIVGIGIRATNQLANMKKEKREKLLQEYGFNLSKDVKSSVPRLTLSLNSGKWVDESIDIYEKIYNEMEPNGVFTDDIREAIKSLHMRAYFDGSEKQLGHHTWLAMEKTGAQENDVAVTMAQLRQAIVKAEGGLLFGNDIFYVESCMYMWTLEDLLKSGRRVWLVYDCFYSEGTETQEEFENYVSENIKRWFYLYFNSMETEHHIWQRLLKRE